ncbi:MAG: type II toxin-antitoxin system HipA family toxin [Gammaproteobacteria bacterium]|nr:type II toxin-antitoxin system HipA family toxin [Gammaproteobacteria bacterium]MBL7005007.1 type II toxin-antitoxin system HipA family toxin [Gammaproteobacteria bacterium]
MSIDSLEVWVDTELTGLQQIGHMFHEHGHIRFEYIDQWLDSKFRFNIDPHLSLDKGSFHPRPDIGNFGMLLDSSPDRWGQTLMKRREAQEAKDEKRKARTLYAWDFLIGVQDQTRQGALRYKQSGSNTFLGDHELPAPPVTYLQELQEIATSLSSKRIDDLDALRKWLSVLVAPGASLGGARPKANFSQKDGSLWIAKFPAKDDDMDIAAWEMLTHYLAAQSGIDTPEAKLYQFGKNYHTFCVKRFDRENDSRVFYASAMTLLEANESEGYSYIDLAQVIQDKGDSEFIKKDLEQLFRRVVFNIMVGNKDDHLRNHGFVLNANGWRLSKAFDVNPNIDKLEHVLNIDESDNRPSLENAVNSAAYYDLKDSEANAIVDVIASKVSSWKNEALKRKIARAEIELMEQAYSESQNVTE